MTAQLRTLVVRMPTAIWLVLVLATMISWTLGTQHGVDAQLATVLVLAVTFFKVHLVGSHFMELREAVLPLRLVFDGYCLVVCAVLIVMYLTGS